jgi:thiamine biosynthesis lipoprotein
MKMRSLVSAAAVVVLLIYGAFIVIRFIRHESILAHEFTGPTMGSRYRVTVDARLDGDERARVHEAIEASLALVTRLMSTYEADSEVSRFNRHTSEEPFALSAETMEVLAMAREISERSNGAFDVTVGPLVDAWGFGASADVKPVPDRAARRGRPTLRFVSTPRPSRRGTPPSWLPIRCAPSGSRAFSSMWEAS